MSRAPEPTRIIPPYIPGNNVKHNVADVDPTVNDDSSLGYEPLSRWVNQTNSTHWVCIEDTVGAALWLNTTEASSGGSGAWKVEEFLSAAFSLSAGNSQVTLSDTPDTSASTADAIELFRNGTADQTRVAIVPSSTSEFQISGTTLRIFGDITSALDTYRIRYIAT